MTGPEHYQRAEEALAIFDAERDPAAWAEAVVSGELAIAAQAAQAHATLAQAAAAALVTPEPSDERIAIDPIVAEWWRVAS